MVRALPSLLAVAALATTLGAAPVHAQDFMALNAAATPVLFPVAPVAPAPVALAPAATDQTAPLTAAQGPTFVRASMEQPREGRPMLLPAMYAAQIALQALDAHSTSTAISKGAHEANPLMKGVVGNQGAMLAVKAGVAAGSIFLAEKMWRRGSRAGAIATMLIVNGVTAAVVANNYKVASTLR
jgi:hypothetical protein